MESKLHWEKIYQTKLATEVSWFQEHATLSLKIILDAKVPESSSIIDVGGGASTLVDDLLLNGYEHVTVLDISGAAIAAAKARLDKSADQVCWLEADILSAKLPACTYDVWHDRAVFHFLINEEERQAYVKNVLHAVKPGGLVIVATFAEDGPTTCSGLPGMRYNARALHVQFGESFQLTGHMKETHYTPGGKEQNYIYCICRKIAP